MIGADSIQTPSTTKIDAVSGAVSGQERRWVLAFASIVLLVTSLPYLFGYEGQNDFMRFTGFVFGVEDGNSYIAKMYSGAAGDWLFRSPYSAEPQRGVLLFLPYLLLGKLAGGPDMHQQLVTLFQLFRLGAGVLAMLASYDFLAFFLPSIPLRRWGLALVTLGGGLGWVLVLLGQNNWLGSLPLDFYSPETFGFLGIYGLPHLSLARAAVLWTLVLCLCVVQSSYARTQAAIVSKVGPAWRCFPWDLRRSILAAGGLWLLAGLAQPLTAGVNGLILILLLGVLAGLQARAGQGHWVAWWRSAWFVAAAGVLPGIYLLYNFWSLQTDPYLSAWTAQNIISSPHPLHYLVAFGLILPFAVLGGRALVRQMPWAGWLPVVWALALPFLAYAPLDLQRRLPDGGWVALVTLALAGVAYGRVHFNAVRWTSLLLLPSSLFLLIGGIIATRFLSQPMYRSAKEVAAFEALAQTSAPGEVVLSALETGNPLPAWAPLRVVIGHGPESAHLARLAPQVAAFYASATSDERRIALLADQHVAYVFWGPAERRLGDWDPHTANYLHALPGAALAGDYQAFEVVR